MVGLGNPGDRYARTRHNVGFEVAALAAERWGLPRAKKRYAGLYTDGRTGPGGPRVGVLLPQTYMNESGSAAGPARGALGVELDHVVAVHDEIDLPFGRIEVRLGGGLAGHNGLKSLRRGLGSADFRRVRVGVGRPDIDRPRDRLGARAGPLQRAQGRGARADRARRRRARPARDLGIRWLIPTPHPWMTQWHGDSDQRSRLGTTSRAAPPGGRGACSDSYSHTPSATSRVAALAEAARREPQRAFVSASLRPYLLASLIDGDPGAARAGGRGRRPRRARPRRRPEAVPEPAPGALLPGARHAIRVAPGAAAPPGRAPHRGAGRAARQGRRRGARHERGRARREGAGPRPAPARLRDREGRPARPRRDRGAARGLRLRARRPGRGARPVLDPRRHPRRLSGHRGARGALRAVRHRGRAAHVLLHLHAALARGGGAGRDRSGGGARPRAPRARRDRRGDRGGGASRRGGRAAGRPLPRAARAGAGRGPDRGGRGGGARPRPARLLGGRDDELPRRGRPPPLCQAGGARRGARDPRGAPPVRASPRTSRTSSAPRRPTPRRARCATPSPSSRSSCARAIARWWCGPGAARRSAPSSTSTASRPPSSTAGRRPRRPGSASPTRACATGSSRPS